MKQFLNILMLTMIFSLLSISNSWAGQQESMMMVASANPCGMKHSNPCNPCGMKHANPCSMKQHNPCGMKHSNPCVQGVSAMQITRPAGSKLYSGVSRSTLVKEGKYLFSDSALSSNGLSCATCHSGTAGFNLSFAQPYPHKVAMAKDRVGVKQVDADEFVQFCVVVPLKGKALAWEGRELAALTAYVVDVKQKAYRVANMNPCGMKRGNPCNPCGMKPHNPCSRY